MAELLQLTEVGTEVDGPLNVFRTLAVHPRLLKRFNVLGGFFMTRGLLNPVVRELAILRTAFLSGSEYEWHQHVIIAERVRVPSTAIYAARMEVPRLDDHPDLLGVLALVDELFHTGDLTDQGFTSAAAMFSDAEVIEIIMLVGFYRMLAGFLVALRVQSEEELSGREVWRSRSRG